MFYLQLLLKNTVLFYFSLIFSTYLNINFFLYYEMLYITGSI